MGKFYRHRYNMGKQYKWEVIMDLEVKDIKGMVTFSSKDLVWTKIHRENMSIDHVALIPSHRVLDFIKGEETNLGVPCNFVRKTNKKPGKRGTSSLRYEV